MISDTELSKILKIPLATLSRWKQPGNDRYSLYRFLKGFTKEEIQKRVELFEGANKS